MAAAALLRISPHLPSSTRRHQHHRLPSSFVSPLPALSPAIRLPRPGFPTFTLAAASSVRLPRPRFPTFTLAAASFEGGGSGGGGGSGLRRRTGGGDDGSDDDDDDDDSSSSSPGSSHLSILGLFLQGWRSRVAADPQFPFKVLMEELVGVTACVLGDMASRPNFGLNELDFVFSTLVVGSILNFVLMYLLAPTAAASSSSPSLPFLFAGCPSSHMFETGTYSLPHRLGTFVYKGSLFAAVGFAAGLVGTAISNALISIRKKLDPWFESPNKPPPTLINALTWAAHMGLSSNLRYQPDFEWCGVPTRQGPPADALQGLRGGAQMLQQRPRRGLLRGACQADGFPEAGTAGCLCSREQWQGGADDIGGRHGGEGEVGGGSRRSAGEPVHSLQMKTNMTVNRPPPPPPVLFNSRTLST